MPQKYRFFFGSEKTICFLKNNIYRELPFVLLHIPVKKNNSCSREHEKAKFVLLHKSDRNMQKKIVFSPTKFEQCFFLALYSVCVFPWCF